MLSAYGCHVSLSLMDLPAPFKNNGFQSGLDECKRSKQSRRPAAGDKHFPGMRDIGDPERFCHLLFLSRVSQLYSQIDFDLRLTRID